MSIQDIVAAVKEKAALVERQDIFGVALIILVAFSSFGLGRLSVSSDSAEGVTVQSWLPSPEGQTAAAGAAEARPPAPANKALPAPAPSPGNAAEAPAGQGNYVASKNGKKYFFTWCASAKSISEANKIYFQSAEAARAAGYTPAANCKGLQ